MLRSLFTIHHSSEGQTMRARLFALFHGDPAPVEFIYGCVSLGWALFVALFGAFATSPTYRILRDMSGALEPYGVRAEWPWALLIGGVGLLQLWALLTNRRRYRTWASFVGMVVWFLLWFSFVAANWRGTATPTYACVWLGLGWCFARHQIARAWRAANA